MRNEKTITLSADRVAVVRELRLKDVRRLVAEFKQLSDLQMTDLLDEQFDRLLAIAGDLVQMPDGETAEDLTVSEAEEIIIALQEVNASFLAKIGVGLTLAPADPPAASEPPGNSTETLAE